MKLGDIELHSILENYFHLDGGAMFGVIPKVIWSKLYPSDDKNMIRLDLNPLLIKTAQENIVVDTGFGDILNEREQTRLRHAFPQTQVWITRSRNQAYAAAR